MTQKYLRLNISDSVRDTGLMSTNYLPETTHYISYGHVTDDVTGPNMVTI